MTLNSYPECFLCDRSNPNGAGLCPSCARGNTIDKGHKRRKRHKNAFWAAYFLKIDE